MVDRTLLDDAHELAELLTPFWAEISSSIPVWHPRMEDPDPEPDPEPDSSKDDPEPEPDPDKVKPDDDWQAKARKHERALKRERKEREQLAAKLAEIESANKSDQEKAIEAARAEARAEAKAESDKERRGDRLEMSVTRLATKGVLVGDGDDAKTAKFADPDDAIVHVERAIAKGEIDEEDIFDEQGKVNTDALSTALAELLERKQHLQASANGARPQGDADGGKGAGAGKGVDDMSVDDHLKAIQKR